MSNDLTNNLYLQYLTALSNTIKLSGDPQIISPYQIWDWGGTQGSMAGTNLAPVHGLEPSSYQSRR